MSELDTDVKILIELLEEDCQPIGEAVVTPEDILDHIERAQKHLRSMLRLYAALEAVLSASDYDHRTHPEAQAALAAARGEA